jgi:hypothetical protein
MLHKRSTSAAAAASSNNADQAPGDLPPDFSSGGDHVTIAGYTVTRADGDRLKVVLGQQAKIDSDAAAPLVMNMVSSSSRGPNFSFNAIKPDVGAPGASVSAQYGTGTGETAFGGTSGAAPMVAGSVALMLQALPGITPGEVKAKLMNTGETNIGINPVGLPGYLAPITRIGGGEVRVDSAIDVQTAAWDKETKAGSLSFGYQSLTFPQAFDRLLVVKNYTNQARWYKIKPTFRYADDEASGAVKIYAPYMLKVLPRSTAFLPVRLYLMPDKLPVWNLNGGSLGGSGHLLQGVEFDGYIEVSDKLETIHVAWQILPHRSANTTVRSSTVFLTRGAGWLNLLNPAS